MSHYSEFSLKFNSKEDLIDALGLLGFKGKIEVHEEAQALYGYRGDVRPQKAHIIIRRNNVGQSSNDIGFEKQPDGSYKVWISDYDKRKYDGAWLARLKSSYVLSRVTKESKKQGWVVVHKEEKGKVTVTLTHW
jgi:hypothetical protein